LNLQVKDSPVKHALPPTGMAAHAMYDPIEAVELEDKHEPMDASLGNDTDDETRSPVMPPHPPPMVNTYEEVSKSLGHSRFMCMVEAWNCA
jgi:hypothetical protein